jgi:predicted GH43/DUF377 family glycosyl hydrolase
VIARDWWLLAVVGLAGCGPESFVLPPASSGAAIQGYRWEAAPLAVLERGPAGAWDSVDVLNPAIVKRGSQYLNLYSGFDGKQWHTGLAISKDGIAWRREGKVLSPTQGYIAANGTVVEVDGKLRYWFQQGDPPAIWGAASDDGRTWMVDSQAVIVRGPYRSWTERGVGDPFVYRGSDGLYLYYLGQDRAGRQQLGVARSTDGGETFRPARANPVLEVPHGDAFDENGLGEPAVWSAGGWFWMLYTGRDRHEVRRMGLARSRDGIAWERTSLVIAGDQAWNAKVVCDPEVEVQSDGRVRVWFGGGDVAHPAERINGAIGVGWLIPVR